MNDSPKLAQPGAGIPRAERLLIGAGLRTAARFLPKERLTQLFRREAEHAIELATALDEERGRRRVLIGRFFGIEDSSRHWSVYMTLEHLVIVNSAIAAGLPRLYAGRSVTNEVRVEEVKPVQEAGPEQIQDLRNVVDRYTDMVDKLGNLRSGTTLVHPWFGALNASEWHALATVHNSVHRRQIQRILRGL
jgi:hypothetical protein